MYTLSNAQKHFYGNTRDLLSLKNKDIIGKNFK